MTTQATHTPGPWETKRAATPEAFPQFGVYAENGNGRDLAQVVSCGAADSAETQANARLIAAAPDLLAALRVTLHRAEQARHSSEQLGPIAAEWLDGIISEAREAIAKAEGGQQ